MTQYTLIAISSIDGINAYGPYNSREELEQGIKNWVASVYRTGDGMRYALEIRSANEWIAADVIKQDAWDFDVPVEDYFETITLHTAELGHISY